MNDNLIQTLCFALLATFVGGWASIWWKLGRLEGRVNGTAKDWKGLKEDWNSLKALCPLCPKTETRSEGELHQEIASGRNSS